MELKKRVTIKQAYKMITDVGMGDVISYRHIREVIPMLPGTIHRGNRWLAIWDEVVDYFNDPAAFELTDDGTTYKRRKEGLHDGLQRY